MWARARYHLRLSSKEFWCLTPRQFHLLWEEHREHMVHTEMLQGWTTAAVVNSSPYRREGVSALQYMPSHRESPMRQASAKKLTAKQQRVRAGWLAKRAQVAAEMRAGGGACLAKLKRGEMV